MDRVGIMKRMMGKRRKNELESRTRILYLVIPAAIGLLSPVGIVGPIFIVIGVRKWLTSPLPQERAIGLNLAIGSFLGFVAFLIVVSSWP